MTWELNTRQPVSVEMWQEKRHRSTAMSNTLHLGEFMDKLQDFVALIPDDARLEILVGGTGRLEIHAWWERRVQEVGMAE